MSSEVEDFIFIPSAGRTGRSRHPGSGRASGAWAPQHQPAGTQGAGGSGDKLNTAVAQCAPPQISHHHCHFPQAEMAMDKRTPQDGPPARLSTPGRTSQCQALQDTRPGSSLGWTGIPGKPPWPLVVPVLADPRSVPTLPGPPVPRAIKLPCRSPSSRTMRKSEIAPSRD